MIANLKWKLVVGPLRMLRDLMELDLDEIKKGLADQIAELWHG